MEAGKPPEKSDAAKDMHVFKSVPINDWKQLMKTYAHHYVQSVHGQPTKIFENRHDDQGRWRNTPEFVQARDKFIKTMNVKSITVTFTNTPEGNKIFGFKISEVLPTFE